MSIIEGLNRSIASDPAKPAVVCGNVRLNFAEVGERVT